MTSTHPEARFCSNRCKQADYRRRHPRKTYRARQHGKRPDTTYAVYRVATMNGHLTPRELVFMEFVKAHDRDTATRQLSAEGARLVAIPARSVSLAQ